METIDAVQEQARLLLAENRLDELAELLKDLRPSDFVDLAAGFDPEDVARLLEAIPEEWRHDYVAQLEPDALGGFLAECRRMLKPEGTLRILTPDLARFARMFLEDPATLVRFWTTAVGVPLPTGTAADVLNLGMKLAGRWQYDVETFSRVAARAGLDTTVSRYGESRHPAMRGIDLRKPDEAVSMYLECTPRAGSGPIR